MRRVRRGWRGMIVELVTVCWRGEVRLARGRCVCCIWRRGLGRLNRTAVLTLLHEAVHVDVRQQCHVQYRITSKQYISIYHRSLLRLLTCPPNSVRI